MSEAQDATALADELAREAATYQVGSRTRQLLHKAADALRATSQTPDAALEQLAGEVERCEHGTMLIEIAKAIRSLSALQQSPATE